MKKNSSNLILFNKPFGVLSQFTCHDQCKTLANFIAVKNFYPAGRLDKDSEGLLILTNDGALQHQISHPRHKLEKIYWAQVEGVADTNAIQQLRKGVMLNDGLTLPAKVQLINEPAIWPRLPPIRFRATVPTFWLEIKIIEGRNRQVRRMTAAVGYPTLRLIRYQIGKWTLNRLQPGEWIQKNF